MDSKSIPIKWRQRKKDDSPFDTTVLDVDRTHLALAFMGNQNHGLHAYIEDLTGWVGNPTGGSDTSRTVSLLLKGLAMMY